VLVDGVPVGAVGPGRLGDRLPAAGAVGEHRQPVSFPHVGVVDEGGAGGVVGQRRPGWLAVAVGPRKPPSRVGRAITDRVLTAWRLPAGSVRRRRAAGPPPPAAWGWMVVGGEVPAPPDGRLGRWWLGPGVAVTASRPRPWWFAAGGRSRRWWPRRRTPRSAPAAPRRRAAPRRCGPGSRSVAVLVRQLDLDLAVAELAGGLCCVRCEAVRAVRPWP
jgi:hypothetical protein